MKIIKVTYTVKAEFAQTNKKNVDAFINDLRKTNDADIRYMAYVGADGKTFTHFALYQNEEAQKILFGLDSFKSFQQQRDASGLEVAPNIESIELVASSFDLFGNN